MKKKLLFVVLALAILTSLAAGTLAVYTKTVSETEQITAKRFAFTAVGDVEGDSSGISLAPTESMAFDFTVTNETGGLVAEVPLQFDITVSFAGALIKMPGLTAALYDGETEVGAYTSGMIAYSVQSAGGLLFEKSYRVVLTWAGDGTSDAAQTDAGAAKVSVDTGLSLTVVANQIVP